MPIEAGAAPASPDPSTPNPGDGARDAIESELAGLMKANGEREDEANKEAPTETDGEPKPEGDDKPVAEAADKKPETDPKTARSLAAVAREKARFESEKTQVIQRLNADIAKHEAAVKEHEALVQSATRWKQSLKSDVFSAVLEAMPDMTPEQADLVARQFYKHAQAPNNPELRAQAAQRRAQAEAASTTEATRRELAEMKAQLEAERKAAKDERDLNEYMGQVESAIGDDTPLLSTAMKKNAKAVRGELAEVAKYLAHKVLGRVPTPGEVSKGWERARRAELERLGIDVDAALKPKTAPLQKPSPEAVEKKRPTTINSELGTTTRPRAALQSQDELDAEIERELAARMRDGG